MIEDREENVKIISSKSVLLLDGMLEVNILFEGIENSNRPFINSEGNTRVIRE